MTAKVQVASSFSCIRQVAPAAQEQVSHAGLYHIFLFFSNISYNLEHFVMFAGSLRSVASLASLLEMLSS